ncbi:MAG TPA: tetratricopeptide repeat protein [Planctomycetaceae bacterium]|nr:tetratricopeptide repeat protein [Planctomycetaceae bacterium]
MPTRENVVLPTCHVATLCLTTLLLVGCTANPDAPEVTLERARIHVERGELAEAVPLYTKVVDASPQRADVFYLRGVAYEHSNLLERALEDYAKCIELNATYAEAINNHGVVLAKLKRFEEAVQSFSRLISLNPGDALALRNRGLCFHDLGETQKSIDDYTKAIEIASQDVEAWFQRGNARLESADYAAAEADLSQAIATDERHAKAWMNRGIARLRLGRRDDALLDLSKAQELDENIIVAGLDLLQDVTSAEPDKSWQSFLDVAEAKLAERGFTELRQLAANASLRFAVYTGQLEGATIQILAAGLVANDADPPSRQILVPQEFLDAPEAATEQRRSRTLMIMEESTADEHSWIVLDMISDWQPDGKKIQPHIVRIAI